MDAIYWLRLKIARIMHTFMVSEAAMSNGHQGCRDMPNQQLLLAASETIKECIILASSNWSQQMASMD